MINYEFQGQVNLLSSSSVGGAQYTCVLNFTDYAGQYTGLDLAPGYFIYLNTDNFALGSFTRYEVLSVISAAYDGFAVVMSGPVDPDYALGYEGIAARVTPNLLLNNGSFQGDNDKLVAYIYNDNFATLDYQTYPYDLVKEPTGFVDPAGTIVTYDGTTRKVTLTGNVQALLRGKIVPELVSGWESVAHAEGEGTYFLYWNHNGPQWGTVPWVYSDIQIALVFRDGVNICIRECHGLMPWQSHEEFHQTIGTYLTAGGDITDFVLSSQTPTNRRPLVSSTTIKDEDLPSVLPALTTNAYSRLWLSGPNYANIETDQTEFVRLSGGIPLINIFDGVNWIEVTLSNNQYAKIFLLAIPATADPTCQKQRFVWVQAQSAPTTLQAAQAITPASINLGHIGVALPEYVYIGSIIIRRLGSNWQIEEVVKLTGTRYNQTASPAGNFLSSVAVDNITITGDGTGASPLSVILAGISTVYTQVLPALVWGPFANPTNRAAQVSVIDNAGSEFECEVHYSLDFSTFTIEMQTPMSGTAVLT